MNIDIDPASGFCYGVVRAIQMAEQALEQHDVLYSLGDIVHNEEEVKRLARMGLQVINRGQYNALGKATVLIRAHGEPPSTYQTACDNGISLLDATCPVVLHLQKKVHEAYLQSKTDNGQVVIYGKSGHAEVNGLVGQTDNQALVIESVNDTHLLDIQRPIYLFAQTTQSINGLFEISRAITQAREAARIPAGIPFHVNDTVCRQVANREHQLIDFARSHDVIIFVGGVKSSNGKVLFEVCRKENTHSHFVSHTEDVRPEWFHKAQHVGICGATSTPQWLMEQVASRIRSLHPDPHPKQHNA